MELKTIKEGGKHMEKNKGGRPTDSVKNHDVKVRMNDEMYQKVCEYAQENSVNVAETIRRAVKDFLRIK